MTWRRLGVLFDALPGHSLTKTAIRDAMGDDELVKLAANPREGHGPWTHEALRLASVEDAVNRLTYVVRAALSSKGSSVKPPDPVPRPGVASKRRQALSDEGRAYLQYLRDHQGQMPPGYKLVAT